MASEMEPHMVEYLAACPTCSRCDMPISNSNTTARITIAGKLSEADSLSASVGKLSLDGKKTALNCGKKHGKRSRKYPRAAPTASEKFYGDE